MSHTETYSYALLPDNIEDAVGCVLELKSGALQSTIDVYGKNDKYVFALAAKKDYHKSDDDRIRLIPLELLNSDEIKVHFMATLVGYATIKEKFVVINKADVSHLNL